MRDLINWKDHVVEYPGRFQESTANGLVTHTPAPGRIKQQGTPQNATNFNIMDLAAFEAMLMASENSRCLRHVKDTLGGLSGDKIRVTLTNGLEYPHNSSLRTVQLPFTRNNVDYTVDCEVVSVTGGAIGDFEVRDKLVNGFKIAFTGSARTVTVDCYVRGGI